MHCPASSPFPSSLYLEQSSHQSRLSLHLLYIDQKRVQHANMVCTYFRMNCKAIYCSGLQRNHVTGNQGGSGVSLRTQMAASDGGGLEAKCGTVLRGSREDRLRWRVLVSP